MEDEEGVLVVIEKGLEGKDRDWGRSGGVVEEDDAWGGQRRRGRKQADVGGIKQTCGASSRRVEDQSRRVGHQARRVEHQADVWSTKQTCGASKHRLEHLNKLVDSQNTVVGRRKKTCVPIHTGVQRKETVRSHKTKAVTHTSRVA